MKCKFKFALGRVEWIEVGNPPPPHFIVPILPDFSDVSFDEWALGPRKHEQIQTRTFNRVALWTPMYRTHATDYEYHEQPRALCNDCGTDEEFLHQWKDTEHRLCLECHEKRINAEIEARRLYL